MSVTINAKGTSTPYFRIGKQGITLYQGSTDPNTLYDTANGDIWLNNDTNSLSIKSANNWVAPTLGTVNPLTFPTTSGSNGQVLSTDGEGNLSWISSSGTGTVTSASVISANGFAGTVANANSTPAITISTSVTGLIKGNGTAISAATAGTDYSEGTSSLTTGILKTTTGTGNLTIAEAGDFPILNQNTTGTANNVTGIVSIANGGTAANTANAAFNNLVPSQVTNDGKYLRTDGTNTSWASIASGTVTSVTVNGTANNITSSGSPVTSSGTITIDLATTAVVAGTYTYPTLTVDSHGRLTSATSNTPVTSFSAGTTGLTPNTTTTGAVTLGGVLNVLNGGTGASILSGYVYSNGIDPFTANTTIPGSAITGAISGNANTATTLQTSRTIGATGDATWSVNFDGSSNVSSALTLATVNSSPQTDAFRKLTVNAKGLVTATSAVSQSDITTSLGYTPVNKAGDTMTGELVLFGDPTNALGAATKQYVDNGIAGLSWKTAVVAGTTANITLSGLQTIDGYTTLANDRILVKNQTTTADNGIYLASAGAWTRATDANTAAELNGAAVYVQNGTSLADTGWVQTTTIVTVGTTAVTWSQFSGSGAYVAGTGLSLVGNTFSNSGVLSVTGTTNQITTSASTGAITLSLPQNINSGAAPTFVGTNFTSIPNSALSNTAITIGSTSIPLGNTALTLAGLTSVTSTSFVGALTGNAGTATKWATARTLAGNSVDGSADVAFSNKFIVQGTTDAGLTGAQFLGALGTGIVKNTTTTGVLSIAVAGDFPTLNQNTTGSAATLTTSRTLWGQGFTGAANVTGSLTSIGDITGTAGVTLTATAGTLALAATGANSITATTNGTLKLTIDSTGNVTPGTTNTQTLGAVGDVWSNVHATTFTGELTGNASTATTLATSRNINGVAFNGSADITVTAAAGTLTGTTLNATVVSSSLTSVGTLSSLTVSGATSLTGATTFVGSAATTPVVITYSATAMVVPCASSNVFTTTFTASVTTAPTFTNLKDGQTINWFITQDATGSRTMTWPTSFKWPGGTAGVLSTAANSVDLLVATYRSATGFWYATLSKGFA